MMLDAVRNYYYYMCKMEKGQLKRAIMKSERIGYGGSMKIVVLDGHALNPGDLSWDGMKALGTFHIYDRTPKEEVVKRIGDAEIVITNKCEITEAIMEQCPSIKYIGILATGYNIVDILAAKKRKIPVCNVPAYSTSAVAQFTVGLILALASRIGEHSQSVMAGDWCGAKDFTYWNAPLVELHGKTMGLIGFGNIGRAVANIVQAMGMKVLVYNRTIYPQLETESCRFTDKETLFSKSDIISLHCPLFPETTDLINKDSIAQMKQGVWIINTARGRCIVEQDLADALNCGKIAAAALDVLREEPMNVNNPLLCAKNVLITPHIAWAAKETRQRLMDIAVENVKAFMNGCPVNVVW